MNIEFKEPGRRRLKSHCFKIYRAYSISFNSSNVGNFSGWNSKKLNQSSGKEKESRCLAFKSSTKHEIRHFHVVVVQWLQRNVQKSVIHEQSCCFTNRNPLLFCRSRLRRRRPCFSPQERFYFNGRTERSCTQTQTELEPLYNSSIIHPESEFERVKDCCYLVIQ